MNGLKFIYSDEDITGDLTIVSNTLFHWHIVCEYPIEITCDEQQQKVCKVCIPKYNHFVSDFTMTVGTKVRFKVVYDNGKEARTVDFESPIPV
jgi:hypothetical protein